MWIILQGPEGTRRVPEGVPYRLLPGEQPVGSAEDETEVQLHAELAKRNVGLGDFVEAAIKALPESIRPTHCSACEKRKIALNRAREIGVIKAVKEALKVR